MSQPNAQEALRRFKARHGHLPGEAKSAAAAVPPLTAAQRKAVEEAIAVRDQAAATGIALAYTGADFQSLIENYRDKKGCSFVTAFEAILRTEVGRQAHKDFLRKKNPHVQID